MVFPEGIFIADLDRAFRSFGQRLGHRVNRGKREVAVHDCQVVSVFLKRLLQRRRERFAVRTFKVGICHDRNFRFRAADDMIIVGDRRDVDRSLGAGHGCVDVRLELRVGDCADDLGPVDEGRGRTGNADGLALAVIAGDAITVFPAVQAARELAFVQSNRLCDRRRVGLRTAGRRCGGICVGFIVGGGIAAGAFDRKHNKSDNRHHRQSRRKAECKRQFLRVLEEGSFRTGCTFIWFHKA